MRRAGGKEVQETVDLCIHIADAKKDWKIEGKRRSERKRMRWLDSLSDSIGIDLSKLWEIVEDREVWHLQSMGLQRVGHNLATEQQQNSWFSSLSSRNLHNTKSSYVSVVFQSCLTLLPRGPQFF